MPHYLMLRYPSANRVYAGEAASLSAAELEVTAPFAKDCAPSTIAGVGYLSFNAGQLSETELAVLARQSTSFAFFESNDSLLRPLQLPNTDALDDDLVTIPKYQGKTNEQFTRLLLNVTLAAVTRAAHGARQVLDPMAGRGTTLSTALLLGHDAFGVEVDKKSFDQMAAFYTTWLRRKRIKHQLATTPVRREGKSIGKRFDATINTAAAKLQLTAFTGDTLSSAKLFGKKKFDAIVTDAPYGVVHGSESRHSGAGRSRERTPAELLRRAIPIWSGQLMRGGAIGISWNTLGLAREDLAAMLTQAGLQVATGGPWHQFAHRVDSSIRRDLIVATKPAE